MDDSVIDNKEFEKIFSKAHVKYTIILPLIHDSYTEDSAYAYCKRITDRPITWPDGSTSTYTPKTIFKWYYKYKSFGMDGLIHGERSDKGKSRALSDEAIAAIEKIRENNQKLSAVGIYRKLRADGILPPSVSERAVQRYIKAHDLKPKKIGEEKERKAFEAPAFGDMWQADTLDDFYITENDKARQVHLIQIIDDHTRIIVGGEYFYNDSAVNFQKVLHDAVLNYGVPKIVYCDSATCSAIF